MSAIEPAEKKRHGCFFYGCITLLVVVFLAAVAAFFAFRYAVSVANAKIAEYTEAQPMIFPQVDMPADQLKLLQARLDAFNTAMEAHSNTPPLVLTSQDINALLASSTNFQNLKGMCYVDIEGSHIKGELSLPLEKFFRFPFVHFKGRYLNGAGTFTVGVTNQMLSVYVETLEVKGKPLPPEFMAQLQGKDMAADFNKNPTNTATLGHFESVEVKDGKIIVKAKSSGP